MFERLKIALISDELTRLGLSCEARVFNLTPLNAKFVLKYWKPDLLFVESTWKGYRNSWKTKIATHPNTKEVNHHDLIRVINIAKDLNIRTIFWDKEGEVNFSRFQEATLLFDKIYTVDTDVKYHIPAKFLPFCISPKIHNPKPTRIKCNKFCFLGSYSKHIHHTRRQEQDLMLEEANKFGLTIYDRNSNRSSENYRYPSQYTTKNAVKYSKTSSVYKQHIGCLNINTSKTSKTMFSRRVVEVLACGMPLISNNSIAMQRFFKDYAFIWHNVEDLREIMYNVYNKRYKQEQIKSGIEYIMQHYTYNNMLQNVL